MHRGLVETWGYAVVAGTWAEAATSLSPAGADRLSRAILRVEAVVFRALARPAGLSLRGGEEGLSELATDGGPAPEITFVLRLPDD